MTREIKFVCNAVKWFDKVNGNTYHSVRITRCSDGQTIVGLHAPYEYGYGDQYRHTALEAMLENGWFKNIKRKDKSIPVGKVDYDKDSLFMFERENNYPIMWNVSNGLKREMIQNGTL